MNTPPWKTKTLAGWGRTSTATVPVARPERHDDLHRALATAGPLTVHGEGRSYGDAAVPTPDSRALLLNRLDRFLSFDEATGLLTCEAGATLASIQRHFLPLGWALPVTPGTSFVALGGAIANDVHGKNHVTAGTLGRHVAWLDLLLPSGEEVRVSRTENAPLFFATLGGLGLTGIIRRVGLHLVRVPGASLAVTQHKVKNLDALFAACETIPAEDDHDVVWLDAMARGKRMGRGILERAHFVNAPAKDVRPGPGLPVNFPNFALNPLSIWLFNQLYYNFTAPAQPRTRVQPAMKFFYPLDSIGNWNRMYGKRGFHQFQAVIPRENAFAGIRSLLEAISASRRASFLAVVKRTGEAGEGLLSFPFAGYTLALDFPNAPGVEDFLRGLVRVTRDQGGRVYLAKDSVITPADFAAMYPQHARFREISRSVDPEGRLTSRMAVRLGLRGTTT